MSNRLRDLIKLVRGCKTAAEERAVIAKECAAIRTSFKDEEADNRHRNVAKLLYIHMLGYPTHWGQMECLKLIVSPSYSDKRVGYLGLMLLLDEKQEVLMLVTNSLKNDLNHPNQFVAGLALCTMGNIGSVGIARDCAPEVEKLLSSTNSYIRKKAALCAIRIARKVPELMENFVARTKSLLNERNHGVLLTGVTLMVELCEIDHSNVDFFRRQQLVPALVRLLKNLVLSGYAPEHDVSGITDPFLQVKILRLLRLLGRGDPEASDQMNDILAQVATNTESTKNVGNSILYEAVQTIMSIESEGGLKVMAINILGRFLLNRDNNIRYVALNTLSKVVNTDIQAVQRHRNTIVDCLKDPDVSIRRRALDLIYSLVNETNIRILVRELLNFLLISDVQFRAELVAKLCMVTEKYAPTKRWHVDTILRVMSIGGGFINDDVPNNLVSLISSSPELQSYAVQKLYLALTQDNTQQLLMQVGIWCIGEFGDLLVATQKPNDATGDDENISITVGEADVLSLIEQILKDPNTSTATRQYCLTSLMKLTSRFHPNLVPRIRDSIETYRTSIFVELQQRSCEYSQLLRWDQIRPQILERMPGFERYASDMPESGGVSVGGGNVGMGSPSSAGHNDLLGLNTGIQTHSTPQVSNDPFDLIMGMSNTGGAAPKVPTGSGLDLIPDLFGSSAPSAPAGQARAAPPPAAAVNLLDDLLGGGPMNTSPAQHHASPTLGGLSLGGSANMNPAGLAGSGGFPGAGAPAGGVPSSIPAYSGNGINILLEISKQAAQPNITTLNAITTSSQPSPVTNLVLQAAVPKYLKVQMVPPSGDVVPPSNSGRVTQIIRVANSMQGQKPILLKLKIEYVLNGNPVSEIKDVAFPLSV